ncbi:MAG TPA: tripartite tricarboxylate transporter substrate binding protein [Usitatibacter sp.]|nr:tripartite tricarboxylate transporter substrate binding protein [Usitatibacter sp.]
MKRFLKRAALAALFLGVSSIAASQDNYPARPVTIVVPYPAGGVADLLPRLVGEKLTQKWGQPVIVENKAGASGNIGMGWVAQQPADGYTFALAPAGNLTVNPTLFPNLPFDTARDFTPVTLLANVPNVLVVHPSVPAKTFQELVAYAKANPGKLNFASPGAGSGAHLAGELLKLDAGVDIVHIPYKGLAPAVNDLLGGQVQMMFAGVSTIIQQVKSGKLRALAVAGPHRLDAMPGVPTVAESGYPGFDVTSWYGIVAKTGTPPAIMRKVRDDMADALKQPDVVKKLADLGLEPVGDTPAQFGAVIQAESLKWGGIVKKAGVRVE